MIQKKQTKKTEGNKLFRSFAFRAEDEGGKIDVEQRTVVLAFSSEEPVERWDGLEILVHDADAVDLSRLNNGAAVLEDHDGRQIGVVERAWLDDDERRVWAELRFSKNQQGDEVFQDIVDGIRRNVSFGYMPIERYDAEDEEDNSYLVTKWLPFEVSMVSVPADPTVGVGRSLSEDAPEPIAAEIKELEVAAIVETQPEAPAENKEKKMEAPALAKKEEKKMEDLVLLEKTRSSELLALGKEFGMQEAAADAVANGEGVDAFRSKILKKQAEELKTVRTAPNVVVAEKREFSICRAILGQISGSGVDCGYEREVSKEWARQNGVEPKGIFVPPSALSRTFNQTTGTGSNMIATDLQAGNFIDMLRNKAVCMRAGAFMLDGLVGNVAIPRQTGAMTSYWFNSETHGITAASNPTVDQVTLSPKTVGAYGDISRSLLKQATPSAEALVKNDIANVLALAIDLAALKGTGTTQPTGITLTSGINADNWAAASTPTWAEVVEMESLVDVANALDGSFVYVMGAAFKGSCKTVSKDSGTGIFLMDSDGTMNGYPVLVSNQMSAGQVIFGKFSDLLIGMWGALDLQVNPYIEALEKAGAIRVTALQDVDVAVRQAKSFCYFSNASS